MEIAASGSLAAIDRARGLIEGAVKLLEVLQSIAVTVERSSLQGAAYKRLALVEAAAGRATAERAAIERMLACYRRAEEIARDARSGDLFYAAANRMAAELALNAGRAEWTGFDARQIAELMQSIAARPPDFWSAAGEIELG